MLIADAQREIRQAYIGGFMGQLVSGILWLVTATLATWGSSRAAILFVIVGGVFIFPLTRLGLAAIGDRVVITPGNPLNALAMQVAFTLPLSLPVVGAAALYRLDWFFPAFMIILGAHYLPFVFLYGMRIFAVLCALLVSAGLGLALYAPPSFALGAWITGGVLLAFAFAGRRVALREARAQTRGSRSTPQ
ncbi:MAG TPA: hypothetical protein VFQ06_10000 [Nitrospira sp.]|nr:hypothetical protein [Nitrospira sp.]